MFVQVERPNGQFVSGYVDGKLGMRRELVAAAEEMRCGGMGRTERICAFVPGDAIGREFGKCSTRCIRCVAVPMYGLVRVYLAKIEDGVWYAGCFIGSYELGA